MKNSLISAFEQRVQHKRTEPLPTFRPGDTVRVHYKIQEGSGDKTKFRLQAYEGVVLKRKKGTADGTFTVRKIGANGVGVERVFPEQSPYVEKIEVIASGIVRRSRLYYLRGLSGKAARIRSRYGGRRSEVGLPGADQVKEEITPELNPEAEKAIQSEEQQAQAAAPAADATETKND